jgi:hypothetical protein
MSNPDTSVYNYCLFEKADNSPDGYGGAFFLHQSKAVIEHCTFQHNLANRGGAMYSLWGYVQFRNNVCWDNQAVFRGGALNFGNDMNSVIANSLFYENSGSLGGAFYLWDDHSQITNCTFSNNTPTAISSSLESTSAFTNCIFWDGAIGTVPSITYSDIQGGHPGIGNINSTPLFVSGPHGNYYLSQIAAGQTQESPCVDAGNPALPMIEGTTRTDEIQDVGVVDMGFHFQPYILPPPPPTVEVTLTPLNPPIVVPANGGWFIYNINVHNFGTQTQTINIWNRLRKPNGSFTDPVFGPITRDIWAGASPSRTLQQTIAGNMPAGEYLYISYVGTYPWVISDSSYFPFTKTVASDGKPWISESKCEGDFFEKFAPATITPASIMMLNTSPNPFNPTTTISFTLPMAGQVNLKVYDGTGRLVSTLVNGWREASVQDITFDATGLAAGVYLYRLEVGGQSLTGKMVLLK